MTDNYEALYRKETSTFHLDYEGRHTGSYVSWLKDKLSDRDKLLSLAEARFRAAEELILEPSALPTEGFLDNELYVKDYILWQQSIVAYDAAVKGEGE